MAFFVASTSFCLARNLLLSDLAARAFLSFWAGVSDSSGTRWLGNSKVWGCDDSDFFFFFFFFSGSLLFGAAAAAVVSLDAG